MSYRSLSTIPAGLDERLEFDEHFERRLPPEILALLEGESPPRTYPLREVASPYLRPAPPPRPEVVLAPPPPVTPPAAKPVQRDSRSGSGLWLLLAFLLGFFVLVGLQPKQFQFGTPPMVEVRRALPMVPRALPLTDSASGQWQSVRFSNGTTMQVYNRGWLAGTACLPPSGRFVGDAYIIGNHYWIWQQPAAAPASWVDP
jgi:hypothetical protein